MAFPVVPNVAYGRNNELYRRVDLGDPAASRLVAVALKTMASEAAVRDAETLAALIAAGCIEATNTSYVRKVFAAADLAAWAADHTNDRGEFDLPDIDFGVLGVVGAMAGLVLCYDPSSAGVTDAVMVPMVVVSWTSTPDGVSSVLFNWNAAGVFRATKPA